MNFQNERLASILLIGSNISQHCLTLLPEEDSQLPKVAVTLLSNLIFYILGAKRVAGNCGFIIFSRKVPSGDTSVLFCH